MKGLYPSTEPFSIQSLAVDNGHCLYFEECGNPAGLPVLFLHGGPGAGCKLHHRGFFDPGRYRTVLLDQRGAGRSTPHGELSANTTQHLLDDLESLRRHLNIERWLLFAGSWGATLALIYAQRHPECVLGMILRGSFLARPADLEWFMDKGAGRIYPEAWRRFMDFIPQAQQQNPVGYLYGLLTGEDELAQRRAARVWLQWGGQVTLGRDFDAAPLDKHLENEQLNKARIELHYATNGYFLKGFEGVDPGNLILDGCPDIAHIPTIIVHGRNDMVCPAEAAFSLHQALPASELRILADAGHIADGETMIDALIDATDHMADRLAP